MSEILFFNYKKQFDKLAPLLFKELGVFDFYEGDSSFDIDGYYYFTNLSGLRIKFAKNNYDYWDDYKYFII